MYYFYFFYHYLYKLQLNFSLLKIFHFSSIINHSTQGVFDNISSDFSSGVTNNAVDKISEKLDNLCVKNIANLSF